jgi:hypothetical protein
MMGDQMTDTTDVRAPAGFAPEHAISFGARNQPATPVAGDNPLPTVATLIAATSTPLTGNANNATVAGPFAPQLGRPIWLTLSGSWSGTAQLLRSTDDGMTKLPLTYSDGAVKASVTGNVNAPVAEESDAAATYYLSLAPASGTVSYRVAQ